MKSSALALLARLVASIGSSSASASKCFADGDELRDAVESYSRDESCASPPPASVAPDAEDVGDGGCEAGRTYGWPMGDWCVSDVTDMSYVFYSGGVDLLDFNEDIGKWDTSKVTNMYRMFWEAAAFNVDLGSWNTSSVVMMNGMFEHAAAFNGDLSSWDTSSVFNMGQMFDNAIVFNGDLSLWDTSSVQSMQGMFKRAAAFNGDVSSWNTSRAAAMSFMFEGAAAFNGDVSSWEIGSTNYMSGMFEDAAAFNQNLCAWKSAFPYEEGTDIFYGSGCDITDDPSEQHNFCASECEDAKVFGAISERLLIILFSTAFAVFSVLGVIRLILKARAMDPPPAAATPAAAPPAAAPGVP